MKVIILLFAALCCSSVAVGNPLQGIFNAENLKAAKVTGVDLAADTRPDSLILKFHPRDEPGVVVVPVPSAARGWTRYAAFTFEFSADSTILYRLHIRNRTTLPNLAQNLVTDAKLAYNQGRQLCNPVKIETSANEPVSVIPIS